MTTQTERAREALESALRWHSGDDWRDGDVNQRAAWEAQRKRLTDALAQPEQPAPQGIRKPYFAHSPEDGFEYFATQSEALEFASRSIAEYKDAANFDGEWDGDVEEIRVGIVTHVARCDGDEASGFDYEMKPICASPTPPQAEQAEASKPLFAGLIAATPGAAEELKAVDAQADEVIRQYEKRHAKPAKSETERAALVNSLLSLLDDQTLCFEEDQEDIIKEAAALLSADSKDAGEPVALPFAILADELAALRRFHECASDGEGYDVPADMMQRLEEIGLVRRAHHPYYEYTNFGLSVLNGDFDIRPQAADAQPLSASQVRACASNLADTILFDLQDRKGLLDGVDEATLQEIVSAHTSIIIDGLAVHGIKGKDNAS